MSRQNVISASALALMLAVTGCSSAGASRSESGGQAATASSSPKVYDGAYTLGDTSLVVGSAAFWTFMFAASTAGSRVLGPVEAKTTSDESAWSYTPKDAPDCGLRFEWSDDAMTVTVGQEGDCAGAAAAIPAGTYARARSFAPGTYETPRLFTGFSQLTIEASDDQTVSFSLVTLDAGGRTGGVDHVTAQRGQDGRATVAIDPNDPSACSVTLEDDPKLGLLVNQTGACEGYATAENAFTGVFDVSLYD